MLDFLIVLVHTTISADGPFSQSRSHILIDPFINYVNSALTKVIDLIISDGDAGFFQLPFYTLAIIYN